MCNTLKSTVARFFGKAVARGDKAIGLIVFARLSVLTPACLSTQNSDNVKGWIFVNFHIWDCQ
jgi:hypothetical protein